MNFLNIAFGNFLADLGFNVSDDIAATVWDTIILLAKGIVILVIGFLVAGQLVKVFNKVLKKRQVDDTIRPFLVNLVKYLLYALVITVVAGTIGIEMTSFVAILASLGLAIGLALQGSLSNFAGGVLILILKPFRVGDFIEAQGHKGVVKEVNIVSTILATVDNKIIFIPNGPLANNSIVNYTKEDLRRVDITFGIDYGDDFDKAKRLVLDIANSHAQVLQQPQPPFCRVTELAGSSVNIQLRAWTKKEEYWNVYLDVQEQVKKTFDAEDVTFPFPQMDVHLDQAN